MTEQDMRQRIIELEQRLIHLEAELAEARAQVKQLGSLLHRIHKATKDFYAEKPRGKAKPVPYDAIYQLYKKTLVIPLRFPDIRDLTDERKTKIRKIWQKHLTSLTDWETYFLDASTKKFLCGENNRGWRADFDFLIRESTPIKMQEGKYGT